ncbi:MAG: hypothetical protein JSU89_13115, partial [Myxococcales bacterium]
IPPTPPTQASAAQTPPSPCVVAAADNPRLDTRALQEIARTLKSQDDTRALQDISRTLKSIDSTLKRRD